MNRQSQDFHLAQNASLKLASKSSFKEDAVTFQIQTNPFTLRPISSGKVKHVFSHVTHNIHVWHLRSNLRVSSGNFSQDQKYCFASVFSFEQLGLSTWALRILHAVLVGNKNEQEYFKQMREKYSTAWEFLVERWTKAKLRSDRLN